ncbi:Photosystem I P700 chlorophyll a apoprotein [Arachis hypogaea]|nr:Photosystem I P700 chlorophyll a apoprotein [Arachis hypogaea]
MLLDSDLPALEVDFLELQKPNWRALNGVGKLGVSDRRKRITGFYSNLIENRQMISRAVTGSKKDWMKTVGKQRDGRDKASSYAYLKFPPMNYITIAILFLIAGHMYRTNWGIGHGIKEILEAHKGPFTGQGHKGLYEILTTSWHAQLSINLAMLGSLTIVVAHHMYSMPPYPYLATDYGTQLSLFTHHMWIGGFLIVGAAAHAAIFMVRDYDPTTRYNDLLDRVLRHRDAIISHLNWRTMLMAPLMITILCTKFLALLPGIVRVWTTDGSSCCLD